MGLPHGESCRCYATGALGYRSPGQPVLVSLCLQAFRGPFASVESRLHDKASFLSCSLDLWILDEQWHLCLEKTQHCFMFYVLYLVG